MNCTPHQSAGKNSGRVAQMAFGCGSLVYLGLAAAKPWIAQPGEPRYLVLPTVVTSLLFAVAWFYTRQRQWSAGTLEWVLVAFGAMLGVNCTMYLAWAQDPMHSTNHMLLMIVGAFVVTSRTRFLMNVVIAILLWYSIAHEYGVADPVWRHWFTMMGLATAVAVVCFETRRAAMSTQMKLRVEAEQQRVVAEQALDDVTLANEARLTMERAMQEAQRRESLGMLAGGIAHDFNNLLTVISANTELAEAFLQPEGQQFVENVKAAANQAAKITRQMLTYAGRAETHRETLELGRRIQEISSLVSSSADSEIHLELKGHEQGPRVDADGAQLDQIILNILQNSLDACNSNGHLVVSWGARSFTQDELAGFCFADDLRAGTFAFAEFRDNGPGMTAEIAERIFDPFFTTKNSGSGLGLAAVEGIVRSHQGALAVETSVDQGTTMTFLLPVSQSTPTDSATESIAQGAAGSGHVLVVDDNAAVLQSTAQLLRVSGYEVTTAESAHDAVLTMSQLLTEGNEPSAALLDLSMPHKDGYSLAAELRQLVPELPVLIMSGFDWNAIRNKSEVELQFLAKPFSSEQLLAAIERLGQRYETAS